MKKRFRVAPLVLILTALMAAIAGCGDPLLVDAVSLHSVEVTPPSGAGSFELAVTYSWRWDGVRDPEVISCSIVTPNSVTINIGNISPKLPVGQGLVGGRATLPFTIPPNGSLTPPGIYAAVARTDSGDPAGVETTFTVTGGAKSTTSSSTEPTTSSTTESTTSEPTTSSTLAGLDINGHWTGTWTYTDLTGAGPLANRNLNKPLPMTLDITVDAQGKGSAKQSLGGSGPMAGANMTYTVPASFEGDTFTFTMTIGATPGGVAGELGQVTREGDHLVINGTFSASNPGTAGIAAFNYRAVWQLTKSS